MRYVTEFEREQERLDELHDKFKIAKGNIEEIDSILDDDSLSLRDYHMYKRKRRHEEIDVKRYEYLVEKQKKKIKKIKK